MQESNLPPSTLKCSDCDFVAADARAISEHFRETGHRWVGFPDPADDPSFRVTPFASGSLRARITVVFLVTVILLDVVAIWSDYSQITLLSRIGAGEAVADEILYANDNRQQTIGGFQLLLLVFTGIPFLMWMHRAHRNLPAIGARNLRFSPKWAVGGWFVPFLNLARPFQVMTEIWKGSSCAPTGDPDYPSVENRPASPPIGWWWAGWLTSYYLGDILLSSLGNAVFQSWAILASDAVDIFAAGLAILVVSRITAAQERTYANLQSA